MSAIGHPMFGDRAAGRQIAWRNDEPKEFEILTWNAFSSTRGTYDGFYSRWVCDHERESIYFVTAVFRLRAAVGEALWDDPPGIHRRVLSFVDVPDSHAREARKIGRKIFGKLRFNNLSTAPYKELPDRAHEGVD